MYGSSNLFKNRVIVLSFAKKIAQTDNAAFTKLVPFVQDCLGHSVPNVKFLACDAVIAAKDSMTKEVALKTFRDKVLPLLEHSDPDVKKYATTTFETYDWATEDPSGPAVAAEAASSSKVDDE